MSVEGPASHQTFAATSPLPTGIELLPWMSLDGTDSQITSYATVTPENGTTSTKNSKTPAIIATAFPKPSRMHAARASSAIGVHSLHSINRRIPRAISTLMHNAEIKPLEDKFVDRKTGIICTVGPATDSPEMIRKLLFAGMGVMRLNFSHGSHEHKAGLIDMLRKELEKIRLCGDATDFSDGRLEDICAVAGDTKGPEIRTGLFEGDETTVALSKGQELTLLTDEAMAQKGSASAIYVDYPGLVKCVKPGDTIFVDDGLINLCVKGTRRGRSPHPHLTPDRPQALMATMLSPLSKTTPTSVSKRGSTCQASSPSSLP